MTPQQFFQASKLADAIQSGTGEDMRVVLYRDEIFLRRASDPLGAYWDLQVLDVQQPDLRYLTVQGRRIAGSAVACPEHQVVRFLKIRPIQEFLP